MAPFKTSTLLLALIQITYQRRTHQRVLCLYIEKTCAKLNLHGAIKRFGHL